MNVTLANSVPYKLDNLRLVWVEGVYEGVTAHDPGGSCKALTSAKQEGRPGRQIEVRQALLKRARWCPPCWRWAR